MRDSGQPARMQGADLSFDLQELGQLALQGGSPTPHDRLMGAEQGLEIELPQARQGVAHASKVFVATKIFHVLAKERVAGKQPSVLGSYSAI